MSGYLNQELGFDEVRWAIARTKGYDVARSMTRPISYDAHGSFRGAPRKVLLSPPMRLFRLIPIANGNYFGGPWWMSRDVFNTLRSDANQSTHGGGRLFRNYVAQHMALPSGDFQLSVVEIDLVRPVYAWVGLSSALFGRPGGMQQIFLPDLEDRGSPGTSSHARVVCTYWLRF